MILFLAFIHFGSHIDDYSIDELMIDNNSSKRILVMTANNNMVKFEILCTYKILQDE